MGRYMGNSVKSMGVNISCFLGNVVGVFQPNLLALSCVCKTAKIVNIGDFVNKFGKFCVDSRNRVQLSR